MFDSISLQRLEAIGLTPHVIGACAAHAGRVPDARLMRVTEVHRDGLSLHDGLAVHDGRALPALLLELAAANDALAVGDWVLASRNAHGQWWAHVRLPPATQIARRLHDGRDKVTRTVIVANVDTALLVMGLDHDFNLRRLERYLALVRLAGVSSVVVLTKLDLCPEPAARLRAAQALLPQGVAAVALDALADDARLQLQPWLERGRTLVLLGASGTGKSTLTNLLTASAAQRIGPNRDSDGRGRHTTTARSLHVTPEGACIIDTPGLRTLRLDSESGTVTAVFDDIAAHAASCRFRNCRHESEPGCAVRGMVAPERLASFRKLLREARRDEMSALERRQQLASWKQRARHGREVARAKRGD